MSSTRMRPLEARMAALRAAKSPGCGCGHAHGDAHPHAAPEPRISLIPAEDAQRASAQSAASSGVAAKPEAP